MKFATEGNVGAVNVKIKYKIKEYEKEKSWMG